MVFRENHKPVARHWHTLPHNVVSNTPGVKHHNPLQVLSYFKNPSPPRLYDSWIYIYVCNYNLLQSSSVLSCPHILHVCQRHDLIHGLFPHYFTIKYDQNRSFAHSRFDSKIMLLCLFYTRAKWYQVQQEQRKEHTI